MKDWKVARQDLRKSHQIFMEAISVKKHNAAFTHDYITKLCTGMTARQALLTNRDINQQSEIGLDHQVDIEKMDLIRRVKLRYASLPNIGSMEKQVERAYRLETM